MKLLHVATLAAVIAAGPAHAAFPEKPVHLVVPLAPGGTTDIVSRLLGEKMQQALGQPIVIENRAGAGGTIASNYVANAKPDGYTILMGTVGTMAIAPAMYGSLPYDPTTAFESISMVNTGQFVFVVNPEVKAKTLPELIQLARENPGKINYGSAGNGSTLHLGMEMLKQRADIDMVHVPYKGSGPLVSALVSGEVQVGIPDIPSALSFIEAGRLRPLAVTGTERASFAPNIPTIAEEGLKDFNVSVWLGLMAPKGTPQAVIDKLNAAVHTALSDEALRQKLSELDSQPKPSSPDEFTAFAKSEREKWKQIVDTAGVRIQ